MGIKWQESDSSIVLRDGRTDHMGKGRAGQSSEQSTHAKGTIVPKKSVSSTLLEPRELTTPLRDCSEEPCAEKPHAGICEGAVRQRAVLP